MEKQQILSFIQQKIADGDVSAMEVEAVVRQSASGALMKEKESPTNHIINVLYAIGGVITLIGVIILLSQHWDEIGFVGRVLVTLGLSFVTYVSGLLFDKAHPKLSSVFFVISAILAPVGVYVVLTERSIVPTLLTNTYIALALALVYGISYFITKRNILVLIVTAFLSVAYYTILLHVLTLDTAQFSREMSDQIVKWATILLGLCYILFGRAYEHMEKADDSSHEDIAVSHVLFGFGALAVLGAGIAMDGWFDFAYILILFLGFYTSVFVKSRAMLILSGLFLMGHIAKLTTRFFVDSLGWPVALISIGFLVIGVGYVTYGLNRKYLRE